MRVCRCTVGASRLHSSRWPAKRSEMTTKSALPSAISFNASGHSPQLDCDMFRTRPSTSKRTIRARDDGWWSGVGGAWVSK